MKVFLFFLCTNNTSEGVLCGAILIIVVNGIGILNSTNCTFLMKSVPLPVY